MFVLIIVLAEPFREKLQPALDHRQDIVEVVGHAAGDVRYRFHFLGFLKPLFGQAFLATQPDHPEAPLEGRKKFLEIEGLAEIIVDTVP